MLATSRVTPGPPTRPTERVPVGKPKPMRPAPALALVVALTAVAGCGEVAPLRVEGAAPQSGATRGPVYAADAMGQPLGRPAHFALTEHASLSSLRWRGWGGPQAVATGRVGGMWCLPGCASSGYPATVELSGLEHHERVSYYTRATVRSADLPPDRARELRDVPLPVPAP